MCSFVMYRHGDVIGRITSILLLFTRVIYYDPGTSKDLRHLPTAAEMAMSWAMTITSTKLMYG